MHGRSAEERKRTRHMWKEPSRSNSVAVSGDVSSSSSCLSPVNSFYKDGRKITVGECALFKPPQDSPPFIGIIRSLTTGKENKLKLGVNWLYRPAEVKLGKGILLEAAPNEIFYSFHKDEIPAASLLHPCKVAFLPKGVELPSGICSFVCRRVYDITNKCLWWLTDQDYVDERQEEVDQLLCKTRLEMHATVQPGGRSPKPMNGPTTTSQLKSAPDGVQNSTSSFHSQTKGKKRDRVDQGSEPVKRERPTKLDDGDADNNKPECFWKSEIAKFTDKGGLVDSEAVEKLVQLMQPEKCEKKINLIGRSILAGVVAATDKIDCLNWFVQMRGLPVFDEWLQEVHKGKIGSGSGLKDSDKSIEDFLLVLLRALDKLPVNLQALQMCNIGKSVNHLRSHKNLEIQKKARSLVDTWKKRVEAEMDARSGSNQTVPWTARSRLPEGNRHSGLSSEVMKSSGAQLSSSKPACAKPVHGETVVKSVSTPQGSTKAAALLASVSNNLKEGSSKNLGVSGVPDLPLASTDEKSSSSSQSHNNSQSCSSDHVKTAGFSGKEDAKSCSAVSVNANKIISGSTCHRKSINGTPGSTIHVVQKETGLSKNSLLDRNPGSEKLSQSTLTSEKAVDTPTAEGNSAKLVFKISSRGRSPAQSASGGSFEDHMVMNSRASSPVLPDRHDQSDGKEKIDAYRATITSDVNTESWQSNDFKEVLTGSDEGDGSPVAAVDEDYSRNGDDTKKLAEVVKAASSSSGNEHKLGKSRDPSFSSMNALIESCAKYAEANSTMSAGDDVGMNLLASVAAGEVSKSDMVSQIDSPQRNIPLVDNSSTGGDSRVKASSADDHGQDQSGVAEGVDDEHEKLAIVVSTSVARNSQCKSSVSQEKLIGDLAGHPNVHSSNVEETAEACLESNVKSEEMVMTTSVVPPACNVDSTLASSGKETFEDAIGGEVNADGTSDIKEHSSGTIRFECKASVSEVEMKKDAEGSLPSASLANDGEKNEELNSVVKIEQKPADVMHTQFAKRTDGDPKPPCSTKDVISESMDELKAEKANEIDCRSQSALKQKIKQESYVGSAVSDDKVELLVKNAVGNHFEERDNGGPAFQRVQRVLSVHLQEPEHQRRSRGSKMTGTEADEAEECTSTAAGGSDMEAKVEFDLNQGFNSDDGRYGDPNKSRSSGCSPVQQLISPMPLTVSSVSTSVPASITVAAAAKRPFVPPVDLLKNKGELGWKGSAATSAFRPAGPRKALEMSVGPTVFSVSDAAAPKLCRPLLDIDLNVPDERILEDLACRSSAEGTGGISGSKKKCDLAHDDLKGSVPSRNSGGFDLDLNKVDEPTDVGIHLSSNGFQLAGQLQPSKTSSGGLRICDGSNLMDFDLNDGPLVDEVLAEPTTLGQHTRNTPTSQSSVSGIRLNNRDMGNFSSWFPQGNHYPTMTIQSILPDRGEQPFQMVALGGPQRMLAPPPDATPFRSDLYRGPVLSSSPALPFPSTPFQYPVLPFGTSFPLPSTTFSGGSATYVDASIGGQLCFPSVHSQILAPAGVVPTQYSRPCVLNLPDSNSNGSSDGNKKWGRQGLDLNAGPLGPDVEGRDETGSLASRQLSVANPQAFLEEPSRIYSVAGGGVLKRKEPEGGWEGYKQSSWQ
ncbi:hypothetical protein K2173_022768 [Erythroxylum novogranatense]|uniref:Uncharacterized protein n=1 Tax=Erythroxylum novogranatense TaxID=1862640 RepID=A0AAV8SMM0_9ROSI|nr:hypothetical protein K2173_022768 [Erythroxylum novogranatense]